MRKPLRRFRDGNISACDSRTVPKITQPCTLCIFSTVLSQLLNLFHCPTWIIPAFPCFLFREQYSSNFDIKYSGHNPKTYFELWFEWIYLAYMLWYACRKIHWCKTRLKKVTSEFKSILAQYFCKRPWSRFRFKNFDPE